MRRCLGCFPRGSHYSAQWCAVRCDAAWLACEHSVFGACSMLRAAQAMESSCHTAAQRIASASHALLSCAAAYSAIATGLQRALL